MKLLALSDVELKRIYHPSFQARYQMIDLLVSCGDLPPEYLEFVMSAINRPLYFVRGNHDFDAAAVSIPGVNMHNKPTITQQGTLIAGIEGCGWYNGAAGQYTQNEMWSLVLQLSSKLIANKARYGRFLDIFITHAPPWGIHDQDDLPHQGIKAFRWFNKNFMPQLHLHGHTHVYQNNQRLITHYYKTTVINCYGFQEIEATVTPYATEKKKTLNYEKQR